MRIRLVEADEPEQNQAQQNQQQQNNPPTQEQPQQTGNGKLDKLIQELNNFKGTKEEQKQKTLEYIVELMNQKNVNSGLLKKSGIVPVLSYELIRSGVYPKPDELKGGKSALEYVYNFADKTNGLVPDPRNLSVIENLLRNGNRATRGLVANTDSIIYDGRFGTDGDNFHKWNDSDDADDSAYKFKMALFLSDKNNIDKFFDDYPQGGQDKENLEAFLQKPTGDIKRELGTKQTKSGYSLTSIRDWLTNNNIDIKDITSNEKIKNAVGELWPNNVDYALRILKNMFNYIAQRHPDKLDAQTLKAEDKIKEVIMEINRLGEKYSNESRLPYLPTPKGIIAQYATLTPDEQVTVNTVVQNFVNRQSTLKTVLSKEQYKSLVKIILSYADDIKSEKPIKIKDITRSYKFKNFIASVLKQVGDTDAQHLYDNILDKLQKMMFIGSESQQPQQPQQSRGRQQQQ